MEKAQIAGAIPIAGEGALRHCRVEIAVEDMPSANLDLAQRDARYGLLPVQRSGSDANLKVSSRPPAAEIVMLGASGALPACRSLHILRLIAPDGLIQSSLRHCEDGFGHSVANLKLRGGNAEWLHSLAKRIEGLGLTR